MALVDFIRGGVKEMVIARPEDNHDLIFKHNDRTIPLFAQATVRADEWAVFAKEGRPVGTLDAGRHTLQTQNIPFLSNFVDSFTGGNIFIAELFFVLRTPFPMKFGGSLGNMIDPTVQIRVTPRCFGELLLRVENPERLIYGYFGMRKFQDHPDIFNWLTDAFFMTVKSTLGRVAREQRRTLADMMDMTTDLGNLFVANAADLAEVGVRVVKVTKFDVNFSDEDLKRFDEKREIVAAQMIGLQTDEIGIQRAALQAQAKAAAAQVGVSQAQFEAQAQMARQQAEIEKARAMSGIAGSFQNYAQGQAMIGAGQGMAQGGGNTGLAGMAAQVGIGMNMGGMLAGGITPGAAPGARGAAAPGVVVPGAMVSCPQCQAQVVPGKFCAECGGTLAPRVRKCGNCQAELAAAAKFCAECGTPLAASPPPGAPPSPPAQ